MQETYTFNRAFFMMRYGDKIMMCTNSNKIYKVNDIHIMEKVFDEFIVTPYIYSKELMGSWVEVKE